MNGDSEILKLKWQITAPITTENNFFAISLLYSTFWILELFFILFIYFFYTRICVWVCIWRPQSMSYVFFGYHPFSFWEKVSQLNLSAHYIIDSGWYVNSRTCVSPLASQHWNYSCALKFQVFTWVLGLWTLDPMKAEPALYWASQIPSPNYIYIDKLNVYIAVIFFSLLCDLVILKINKNLPTWKELIMEKTSCVTLAITKWFISESCMFHHVAQKLLQSYPNDLH